MTICIAAICEKEGEEAIISASDRMVSMSGMYSADNLARKVDPIKYGWTSMLAGNDISPAVPILDRINLAAYAFPTTLKSIADTVKNAYRQQRLDQMEDEVLGSIGFTWETFRSNARNELSDRAFENVLDRISAYELELEFLVQGFDDDGEPHIFTVHNPGKCDYYDKIGFWAIGSGQHQAIASLFWNKYDRFNALNLCVAHVLAAKFMAESAVGVGKETWLFIDTKKTPNRSLFISKEIQMEFRTKWQSLPKIPWDMLAKIETNIRQEKEKIETEIAAQEAKKGTSNLSALSQLLIPQKSDDR